MPLSRVKVAGGTGYDPAVTVACRRPRGNVWGAGSRVSKLAMAKEEADRVADLVVGDKGISYSRSFTFEMSECDEPAPAPPSSAKQPRVASARTFVPLQKRVVKQKVVQKSQTVSKRGQQRGGDSKAASENKRVAPLRRAFQFTLGLEETIVATSDDSAGTGSSQDSVLASSQEEIVIMSQETRSLSQDSTDSGRPITESDKDSSVDTSKRKFNFDTIDAGSSQSLTELKRYDFAEAQGGKFVRNKTARTTHITERIYQPLSSDEASPEKKPSPEKVRVKREKKELFTVIRNVRDTFSCRESGMTQAQEDSLFYFIDGVQRSANNKLRALTLLGLLEKVASDSQFVEHLLRSVSTFSEIVAIYAEDSNAVATIAAAIFYILAHEYVQMQLDCHAARLVAALLPVITPCSDETVRCRVQSALSQKGHSSAPLTASDLALVSLHRVVGRGDVESATQLQASVCTEGAMKALVTEFIQSSQNVLCCLSSPPAAAVTTFKSSLTLIAALISRNNVNQALFWRLSRSGGLGVDVLTLRITQHYRSQLIVDETASSRKKKTQKTIEQIDPTLLQLVALSLKLLVSIVDDNSDIASDVASKTTLLTQLIHLAIITPEQLAHQPQHLEVTIQVHNLLIGLCQLANEVVGPLSRIVLQNKLTTTGALVMGIQQLLTAADHYERQTDQLMEVTDPNSSSLPDTTMMDSTLLSPQSRLSKKLLTAATAHMQYSVLISNLAVILALLLRYESSEALPIPSGLDCIAIITTLHNFLRFLVMIDEKETSLNLVRNVIFFYNKPNS